MATDDDGGGWGGVAASGVQPTFGPTAYWGHEAECITDRPLFNRQARYCDPSAPFASVCSHGGLAAVDGAGNGAERCGNAAWSSAQTPGDSTAAAASVSCASSVRACSCPIP